MMKTTSMPTMPKTAVKMLSMKMLANEVIGVAQGRMRAAAAGLEHTSSVMKAGEELLK